MKLKPFAPALAVLLVVAALAGCLQNNAPAAELPEAETPDAPPRQVVLAIQPTDNAGKIQDKATELEAFLEARTGFDVVVHVPLTNAGVIEALRFGHADVAFMGSWPAELAAEKADARIVLAEMRDVVIGNQSVVAPHYFSYYVVMKDSPVQTMEDLRGKSVAYTSLTSTSGYVYPVARLVELGLIEQPEAGKEALPGAFFGSVHMAGGYGQAWDALRTGQVDVAVIAGDVKASLYHEVLDATRVVETQGPVPSHAVVFAKDFDGADAEKMKAALLELKGEHKELMRNLVSGIFVEFAETTTEAHTGPLGEALGRVGFKFNEKLG